MSVWLPVGKRLEMLFAPGGGDCFEVVENLFPQSVLLRGRDFIEGARHKDAQDTRLLVCPNVIEAGVETLYDFRFALEATVLRHIFGLRQQEVFLVMSLTTAYCSYDRPLPS